MDDECGFECLGADEVKPISKLTSAEITKLTPVEWMASQNAEYIAQGDPTRVMNAKKITPDIVGAVQSYGVAISVGAVAGALGLGLLWKAHRVAGALLGGLFLGPMVGGGIGFALAANKMKKL